MSNSILTKKILYWYDNNKRPLPWRKKISQIKKEYYTLVSEFMLQQTQVKTVIPYFNKFIKDIKYYFSGRKILICREMTKFYEEYTRLNIDELEPFKSNPKGELTIVISEMFKKKNSSIMLKESDKQNIKKMIKKLSIKDITDLISQNTNVPKKEIYNYCLKLKNEK